MRTKSKLKLNKLWFNFSNFRLNIKWPLVVLFVCKSHVLKDHIPLASMQGDPRILPSPPLYMGIKVKPMVATGKQERDKTSTIQGLAYMLLPQKGLL